MLGVKLMKCKITNNPEGVDLYFECLEDGRFYDSAFIPFDEFDNDSVILEKIFLVAKSYPLQEAFKYKERAKSHNVLKFLLKNYSAEIEIDLNEGIENFFNITWLDEAECKARCKNDGAITESAVSSMCTTGKVKMDKDLSMSAALLSVSVLSKSKIKREIKRSLENVINIAVALEERANEIND